jgi:hypothetical protein
MAVAVPVLPCASVAEHVTVVVPRRKIDPDADVHVGVSGPSTRSVAVDVNIATAPVGEVCSTVTLAAVTVGGVVSRTVTRNDAWALSASLSEALKIAGAPCGPVASGANAWLDKNSEDLVRDS